MSDMSKKRIVFLMTHCKKSGPVQQMLNIIKNLDRDEFVPYLVTLYPEDEEGSQLEKYLPYVEHRYAPSGKLALVMGRATTLEKTLDEIKPDVIHSLGVFPDFAVSRMKRWKQVITLRNFVWDDYPAKFGKLQGGILAKLHLYAMKHTSKTVACSESLSKIYKERLGLEYGFIRNGVDVEQYSKAAAEEKSNIRKELGLPQDAFIYAYTGQMIERKNVGFLLEVFKNWDRKKRPYLLLLGGGVLLDGYKTQYGELDGIDFQGNVENVNHYLKACDAYVSTSMSEGLPNGVLEAMATGLPVVLSDIVQHLEIFEADNGIGAIYHQGEEGDLQQKLQEVRENAMEMGERAFESAHRNFSAKGMSENYQKMYKEIATI